MPMFSAPGGDLELPRNVALVDTNVLAAFANEEDGLHEQARAFLEQENRFSLLVVGPVIVETCGVLARRSLRTKLLSLLRWLTTPGNAMLFPSHHAPKNLTDALAFHATWMSQYNIDYVDTYLMEAAHQITERCDLRPAAPIVTFDTSEFLRCFAKGQRYRIFDMRTFDLVE